MAHSYVLINSSVVLPLYGPLICPQTLMLFSVLLMEVLVHSR
uniref:Uncharacterized protein n=1 Tax=Arundo donax TaxID=35708 RepID=A0A0A9G6A7_ARUDO